MSLIMKPKIHSKNGKKKRYEHGKKALCTVHKANMLWNVCKKSHDMLAKIYARPKRFITTSSGTWQLLLQMFISAANLYN